MKLWNCLLSAAIKAILSQRHFNQKKQEEKDQSLRTALYPSKQHYFGRIALWKVSQKMPHHISSRCQMETMVLKQPHSCGCRMWGKGGGHVGTEPELNTFAQNSCLWSREEQTISYTVGTTRALAVCVLGEKTLRILAATKSWTVLAGRELCHSDFRREVLKFAGNWSWGGNTGQLLF